MCVCFSSANTLPFDQFHHLLNKAENISPDEQQEIKSLFRDLFFYDVFAYSLFGDKPLSISRAILNSASQIDKLKLLSLDGYCFSILEHYCEPSTHLKKKWETWCKYKDAFQTKKYFLFQKKIGSQIRLFIINKAAFLRTVNEHFTLFRHIIGPKFSAENLLEEMKKEDTDVFDILHHHEGLLGILLGFGKRNSMLFQKREDLIHSLGKDLRKPDMINNQIEFLNHKLKALHEHDACIISSINRIGFSADPTHLETIQIRNKYDQLNRKINHIYSKEDWFEQTLIQFISN
jgi:hypothetical protein